MAGNNGIPGAPQQMTECIVEIHGTFYYKNVLVVFSNAEKSPQWSGIVEIFIFHYFLYFNSNAVFSWQMRFEVFEYNNLVYSPQSFSFTAS